VNKSENKRTKTEFEKKQAELQKIITTKLRNRDEFSMANKIENDTARQIMAEKYNSSLTPLISKQDERRKSNR
jgi:hypothetical protein